MSFNVYATGLAEGEAFAREQEANDWLTACGFVRREKQPGQWVQFHPDGNRFASVTRPDESVWSR